MSGNRREPSRQGPVLKGVSVPPPEGGGTIGPLGISGWLSPVDILPLVLSVSKDKRHTPCPRSWFDRLTTSGLTKSVNRAGWLEGLLRQLNIASWVTLSRLLLLPVALVPVSLHWRYGLVMAAGASVVAGISDIADGYLARRLRCASLVGANLDLLADKLFVSVMMLCLALHGIIPFWVPGVVVAREVAVSLMRVARFGGRVPPSDVWGKVKMATSVVAIVGLLLKQDLAQGGVVSIAGAYVGLSMLLNLAWWVMLLALALTVLSGANYLASYSGLLPRRKAPNAFGSPGLGSHAR